LKDKGFNPGTIDGVFGLGTKSAVRAFQKANDLVADGIVGQQTWKALGMS
jgi:peptidoglycan hydrolase-like protein with peptidoglycan-binding domain